MALKPLKPHQRAIVIAAVLTLVSWFILPLQLVLLPLQFLNTHLHEMAHAITAVATGGEAHFIAVYGDASGVPTLPLMVAGVTTGAVATGVEPALEPDSAPSSAVAFGVPRPVGWS